MQYMELLRYEPNFLFDSILDNPKICLVGTRILGPFGNIIVIMLFKCCGNTCEWESVVKIRVVMFTQQQKMLFKQFNFEY